MLSEKTASIAIDKDTMRIITRIILFIFLFSGVFYVVRSYDIIHIDVLSKELNGIGWLYSTIGLIFGVLSGFVIQTQWHDWDKLISAMHGELKSLRQLYQYSMHLSPHSHKKIKKTLQDYLHEIVTSWHQNLNGGSTSAVNSAIKNLQEDITELENNPQKFETANRFFISFLDHHEDMIHYSSRRLPKILHILILFSSTLVIGLSLFIGVRTLWLDYIATLAIALLAFLIYYVIHDLDQPLKVGNWHITNHEYLAFFEEIQKE